MDQVTEAVKKFMEEGKETEVFDGILEFLDEKVTVERNEQLRIQQELNTCEDDELFDELRKVSNRLAAVADFRVRLLPILKPRIDCEM